MKILELLEYTNHSILYESRLDFLKTSFGEKLEAQSKLPADQIFNQFVEADPTPQKKYVQWLIRLYLNGTMPLEDLYKASDYITLFLSNVRSLKPSQRDVNQYKSLPEMYDVVRPIEQEQQSFDNKMVSKEQAEVVYNTSTMMVVVPKTQEASCYFGKGTDWCTASDTEAHNQFNNYNDQGKLYIIIDKNSGTKFQWHYESDSFMDAKDRPISAADVIKQYPEIRVAIGSDNADLAILLTRYPEGQPLDLSTHSDAVLFRFGLSAQSSKIPRNYQEYPSLVMGMMSKPKRGGWEDLTDDVFGDVMDVDITEEILNTYIKTSDNPWGHIIQRPRVIAMLTEQQKLALAATGSAPAEALLGNVKPSDMSITDMVNQNGMSVEALVRIYEASDYKVRSYDVDTTEFTIQSSVSLQTFFHNWISPNSVAYRTAKAVDRWSVPMTQSDGEVVVSTVINNLSSNTKEAIGEVYDSTMASRHATRHKPDYDDLTDIAHAGGNINTMDISDDRQSGSALDVDDPSAVKQFLKNVVLDGDNAYKSILTEIRSVMFHEPTTMEPYRTYLSELGDNMKRRARVGGMVPNVHFGSQMPSRDTATSIEAVSLDQSTVLSIVDNLENSNDSAPNWPDLLPIDDLKVTWGDHYVNTVLKDANIMKSIDDRVQGFLMMLVD